MPRRYLRGMANLKIQYWPIERLRHFAGNARAHSDKQLVEIARSIQRFGFVNPILVDPEGEIIAGHGRAIAADKLLLDKVPVIVLADLSDAEKRALRLADNRIAENSTWDEGMLRAELRTLAQLDVDTDGLGFDTDELDKLLAEAVTSLPATPLSDAPAPRQEPPQPPADDTDDIDDIEPAPVPAPKAEPKASDDDYSVFELVMLHENKIRLVECLSSIRADQMYDKLEDALMHLVRHYEGDPGA